MSSITGTHELPRTDGARALVSRRWLRLYLTVILLVLATLAASACFSDNVTIEVTLRDQDRVSKRDYLRMTTTGAEGGATTFGVVDSVRVTFDIDNATSEPHQFTVVNATARLGTPFGRGRRVDPEIRFGQFLRKRSDGSADLGAPGIEVLGETLEIAPGDSESVVYTLGIGYYVLMCNQVVNDDGQIVAHYSQGMSMLFEVSPDEFPESEDIIDGP